LIEPSEGKAIRALLAVMGGQRSESSELFHRIPPSRVGKGKARISRKMVLLAIAASANPHGTGAWPSRETIAARCLITVRAVDKVIGWLRDHKLLKVKHKGAPTSKYGRTNHYTILFPARKKVERKPSLHGKGDVQREKQAPGTTEAGTRNNSRQQRPGSPYYFWSGESKPKSAVGDWQRSLAKLFDLAKVPRAHAHRFRDTFAVESLLADIPIEQVSALLGHQSLRVTERHYAPWVAATQEELEASVRRV